MKKDCGKIRLSHEYFSSHSSKSSLELLEPNWSSALRLILGALRFSPDLQPMRRKIRQFYLWTLIPTTISDPYRKLSGFHISITSSPSLLPNTLLAKILFSLVSYLGKHTSYSFIRPSKTSTWFRQFIEDQFPPVDSSNSYNLCRFREKSYEILNIDVFKVIEWLRCVDDVSCSVA